jgi:hypothetical protein
MRVRTFLQHHLNSLTIYARLRTVRIPRCVAEHLARLWEMAVHPLLYPEAH